MAEHFEYESNKKNNKMKNIISQDKINISMTAKAWQNICRALDTVYPKIYSINCLTDHPRNYHF